MRTASEARTLSNLECQKRAESDWKCAQYAAHREIDSAIKEGKFKTIVAQIPSEWCKRMFKHLKKLGYAVKETRASKRRREGEKKTLKVWW